MDSVSESEKLSVFVSGAKYLNEGVSVGGLGLDG